MAEDEWRDAKGRLKKGAPPLYKGKPPPPPDTDQDFDTALIASASSFGTGPKVKVGLAGYCANLRDTRPVEYAALLKSALARTQQQAQSAAAAIPITVEFTTAPAGFFLPPDEARALWAARTGAGPQLVIDNAPTAPIDDTDPDDQFDDPDDDAA